MRFKIKVCLTVLFVILILLAVKFYVLSPKEVKNKDDKEKEPKEILMDNPSVLPNWSNGKYHDYYGTTQMLEDLNNKYKNLVNVFSIGKSVQGKDIWCIKITNENNNSRKFSCLIDGCIHGYEWESGEACLYLAEYLVINYCYNNTVSNILNNSDIYLVPILNPDGRQKDDRWNDNGIDLNRNFDADFGRLKSFNLPLGKLFGIIKIPKIEFPRLGIMYLNCGRYPFSEPETRALRDLANRLSSKDFSFYVNCHTALHFLSSVCNVNYKPEFTVTNHERDIFNSVLDWVGENTEYSPLYGEQYQHAGFGSSQDWIFKKFRIVSFTFEMLNKDYDPGYNPGGRHDRLVHWMKTTLPVFLYLLVNIGNLHDWKVTDIEPPLPEGVPPPPFK